MVGRFHNLAKGAYEAECVVLTVACWLDSPPRKSCVVAKIPFELEHCLDFTHVFKKLLVDQYLTFFYCKFFC